MLTPTRRQGLLLVTIQASCSFPHSHLHLHPLFFFLLSCGSHNPKISFALSLKGRASWNHPSLPLPTSISGLVALLGTLVLPSSQAGFSATRGRAGASAQRRAGAGPAAGGGEGRRGAGPGRGGCCDSRTHRSSLTDGSESGLSALPRLPSGAHQETNGPPLLLRHRPWFPTPQGREVGRRSFKCHLPKCLNQVAA